MKSIVLLRKIKKKGWDYSIEETLTNPQYRYFNQNQNNRVNKKLIC